MVYRFHDYTLDPARRELRHGAQRIALEPKVFQVLLFLLEHRGRVVSKAELLEQCWPETFVSEAALARCLVRLRKAVQATPTAPPVIETLHRQGYRLVADVTVLAQMPPSAPVDTALTPAMPPLQASVHPVPPEVSDTPAPLATLHSAPLPPPPARRTCPGIERRQLTVLSCAVVDATSLAARLDLEDLHDVLMRYHATCTAVSQRYGGHIAHYRGEGLLVYFGYPLAHEDDTQRAIHAGLALLTGIRDLGHGLVQDFGVRLAIRVGIHTGLVVVGAGEGGPSYRQLALGATLHLAAKIQGWATPDTVVISAATYHLVQGYFVCQPLGAHRFPGTTEPSALYQVLGASAARGRLDLTLPQHLTPLVGRETELAVLWERVAQVRQGLGQVVLLQGEAGMGKSRLVQVVKTTLMADGYTVMEFQGSPYYQHTALHPVIAWLQRCIQDNADTPVPERMARLEALVQQARLDLSESLPLLAALLRLDLPEERYPALQLTPRRQQQRTLEMLLALVLAHAERQPVLCIVEDLHWIDPTTLEWLGLVIDQGPTAPLCTLMTSRPTFPSPWDSRTHVTHLTLPRLASRQVEQMVQWLGGDRLSATHLRRIVTQTDGVPLFVEEVTKFVLAVHRLQGYPSPPASGSAAREVPIPATLQDSLMARLDQLGPTKGTAQLGATIGREFSAALLQAVTPLEEDSLRQDLAQLVEAELLYQRGVGASAVYVFKHALMQEAAYASLVRKTRQRYHQHIAQALETQFPDTVAAQPELLAHHYTEAGLNGPAVDYWQRAGHEALERSAYVEATSHLTTGLEVLKRLPRTPERHGQELGIQLTLALALHASKGHAAPEIERAYARAHALCGQVDDTPQLFRALLGLYRFYAGRRQLQTSCELTEQLSRLAQRAQDPDLLLEAHMARGTVSLLRGELVTARRHLEQAIALYDVQHQRSCTVRSSVDPGVISLSRLSWVLWLLGYPDQAFRRGQETLALAQALAHPHSLATALSFAAMFHQFRRDVSAAEALAEATMTLATEQGMAQRQARGTFFRGWALTAQGRGEDGLAQMRQGQLHYRATGTVLDLPWCLGVLAKACGSTGRVDEGLDTIAEALAVADHTGYYEAELYRASITASATWLR